MTRIPLKNKHISWSRCLQQPMRILDHCASYKTFILRPVTGKVFAVVNENLQNSADYPGILYEEVTYDNNQDTIRLFLSR